MNVLRMGPVKLLALLSIVFVILGEHAAAGKVFGKRPDQNTPHSWREDAELTDVFFLNPKLGWAVGDQGTILHSADGGRRWELQSSETGCRLESIQFIDEKTGFAAGGFTSPYTHTSQGVLLRTQDGGRNWKKVTSVVLPRLKKIRMGRNRGWLLAEASDLFPSGIFTTHDGGKNWTPVATQHTTSIAIADFQTATSAMVVDTQGIVGRFNAHRLTVSKVLGASRDRIRNIHMAEAGYGWIVGLSGQILRTVDAGLHWKSVAGKFPLGTDRLFDFSAVASVGKNVWVAGTPGSVVWHSSDAGESWQPYFTGASAPITAITFVDRHRGWAVGSLGTILTTRDGGRTWRRGRGKDRLALLGVSTDSTRTPLELYCQLCGNDGYHGGALLFPIANHAGQQQSESIRFHDAITSTGAAITSQLWRFPIPKNKGRLSPRNLVASWERESGASATRRLEEQIVKHVRIWRPDVVFIPGSGSSSDDPVTQWIGQIILQAVKQADNKSAYTDQLTQAGLKPWRVTKVFNRLPSGRGGSANIITHKFASRLGCTLAEQATRARSLLEPAYRNAPAILGFGLLLDERSGSAQGYDFFDGIAQSKRDGPRRSNLINQAQSLILLKQKAEALRRVEKMAQSAEDSGLTDPISTQDLHRWTQGLDDRSAAEIVYHISQILLKAGKIESALGASQYLIQNFPDQPLAEPTVAWMLRYATSREIRWRFRRNNNISPPSSDDHQSARLNFLDSAHESDARKIVEMQLPDKFARNKFGLRINQHVAPRHIKRAAAAKFAKYVQRTYPMLAAKPEIAFCLASALRDSPAEGNSARALTSIRRRPVGDSWRDCLDCENWLTNRQGKPAKPIAQVLSVRTKPFLDGKLADPMWRQAKPIRLANRSAEKRLPTTTIQFASDDEFLYVAVQCAKDQDFAYHKKTTTRQHDQQIFDSDRIVLQLDLDRDYETSFQFAIDYRGLTYDSCWIDPTWNPTWYVAADADRFQWRVEIAIPIEELTGDAPRPGDAWLVSAHRRTPGGVLQSFSGTPNIDRLSVEASRSSPDDFGLLLFGKLDAAVQRK